VRLAVIDVGTNTIRLLVVERVRPTGYRTLFADQEITRLGQGLLPDRTLQPEPIRRSLALVRRFRDQARAQGATRVVAVGTSALRVARNAGAFAAGLGALGIECRVISGAEEARLALRGVRASLPDLPPRLLMMDIGGGSTEFLLAEGAEVRAAVSTDLGSVGLSEAYLRSDPPATEELDRLRWAARVRLARLRDAELPPLPPEGLLVGTAGTVTTLAAVDLGLRTYDAARVNGHRLSGPRVASLLRLLAALPVARRREVPGLEPGRADIIVGGAAICLEAMEALAFPELRAADGGLREGLVLHLLSVSADETPGNVDKSGTIC